MKTTKGRKVPAKVNSVTAEVETTDLTPEAPVNTDGVLRNRGRGLCVVCKERFAFNDDGTCNSKECPSYSTRMKQAATDRQAEIASEKVQPAGFVVGDKVTLANSGTVLTIKHVNGRVALLSNGSKVSVSNIVKADPRMTATPPTAPTSGKGGLASKLGSKPLPAPAAEKRTPPTAPPSPDKTQPERLVGFRWRSQDGHYGILRVEKDGEANDYLLTWVSSTSARVAVQLTKLEPSSETRYTVSVLREGEQGSKCGCIGHKKHGHCKHVEAVKALVAAQKL